MKTIYALYDIGDNPELEFDIRRVHDDDAAAHVAGAWFHYTKKAAMRSYIRQLIAQISDMEIELKNSKAELKRGRAFAKRNKISVAKG